MAKEAGIEKVVEIDNGGYYFIFPPTANPELVRKTIRKIKRTFPLIVAVGLTIASLVLEIAVKPRLIKLHSEFELEVPLSTRFSFLVSLFMLIILFAFVAARDRKLEYTSQKMPDGRIKVTPDSKGDRVQEMVVIVILLFYTAFLIMVIFGPLYMVVRG